jgi:hypothetical protein
MNLCRERANYVLFQDMQYFMPKAERYVLAEALKGEEGDYIADLILANARVITDMPVTYGQDGLGSNAIVHLHYFTGTCDWYITEKDQGDGTDDKSQYQAFGYANLGDDDCAEMGYISIQELIEAGVELDLYWTPKRLKEVMGET